MSPKEWERDTSPAEQRYSQSHSFDSDPPASSPEQCTRRATTGKIPHTQLFNQHSPDADLFVPFPAEIQARLKEAQLKEARLKEARLKQAQLKAAQLELQRQQQQQRQREERAAATEQMHREAAAAQRRLREFWERRAQQAQAERRRIRVVRPSPFAVTASGQILHPPPTIQLLDAGDLMKLFRYGKKLIFRK